MHAFVKENGTIQFSRFALWTIAKRASLPPEKSRSILQIRDW